MTKESREFWPCPFCGSDNLAVRRPMQVASDRKLSVDCMSCGATADSEVWNRRMTVAVCDPPEIESKEAGDQ
jgi:transcription elongation factor Elf1